MDGFEVLASCVVVLAFGLVFFVKTEEGVEFVFNVLLVRSLCLLIPPKLIILKIILCKRILLRFGSSILKIPHSV